MRNSSVAVISTVLMAGPFAEEVVEDWGLVDLSLDEGVTEEEDEVTLEVPSVGICPVACWISFPCSLIRAGPSWLSFLRS